VRRGDRSGVAGRGVGDSLVSAPVSTCYLGVDVGTSSSKGVLVDPAGRVLARARRTHAVVHPRPAWAEMHVGVWWDDAAGLIRDLLARAPGPVGAVGVSGMGPCLLVTDAEGTPLRDPILYGNDTRATVQIDRLAAELGADEILDRTGSPLTAQAVGPKIAWIVENEPQIAGAMRRLFMTNSWLVHRLTGEYVLDHLSASQAGPMYDVNALDWYHPWADMVAPGMELPRLCWPGDVAGQVSPEAAATTGLTTGTPVITGTIDAWSEAVSVGAQRPGDLMLMYGTTMFLLATTSARLTSPQLWGTVGAVPETRCLAAGMATSGAVTGWLRDLFGSPDFASLLSDAAQSPPGSKGLVLLPYLAGERTPLFDPDARGLLVGMTLAHGRGDLYRAALEATAYGVRHNLEVMQAAGADITRVVAVGGGTEGVLWTRIVSDVAGLVQELPTHTVGASYGAAFLAAGSREAVLIENWNPKAGEVRPDDTHRQRYDDLYAVYRDLYPATVDAMHTLAAMQKGLRTG
jgi:xylulokinase